MNERNEANNPSGLYLAVDDVFPGAEKDFNAFTSLLATLSLTDTLLWCARINLLLSNARNPRHEDKQVYLIQQFFARQSIVEISRFMAKHGGPRRVQVFLRPQLLELFRWVCVFCQDLPGDGNTFNNAGTIETFCRAALMASDVWARRTKLKERTDLHGGVDAARLRSLDSVRRNYEATTMGIDPILALGRAHAIFCEHFPKYHPNGETEFLAAFGLSIDAYLACAAYFAVQVLNVTPESIQGAAPANNGIFDLANVAKDAKPSLEKALKAYLALEAKSVDEFKKLMCAGILGPTESEAAPYDYNILRRNPILRTNDERAIVIDPVLFTEKILAGPLFHLIAAKGSSANTLFDAFGRAFESYAASILTIMFRNHNPNPLTAPVRGQDLAGSEIEIADAVLTCGRTSFVFEFKAVWIRDDKLLLENSDEYIKHLRSKYGVNQETGTEKGVAQLAKSITKLAASEWKPESIRVRAHSNVFPVLLVNDHLVSTPGHCWFLANEFKDLLQPDKTLSYRVMQKGAFRVAPLIVMSIQDLEDLETSTRDFSLREFLLDYSRDCADRIVSVHNYISTSPKYKNRMRQSVFVANNAEKALSRMSALVLGEPL